MFFWKIDDETIRCLINKQEIGNMGYDLKALNEDVEQMEAFLEAIVQSSHNYIDWHTENGIQNYAAKELPADQYLITISCTFQDDIIDRNLDQIRRMTEALNTKITEDRIREIYALSGEEKEKAFAGLSKDLNDVCNGSTAQEIAREEEAKAVKTETGADASNGEAREEKKPRRVLPDRELVFTSFEDIIRFADLLEKKYFYPSSLYKDEEEYVLLVSFKECLVENDVVNFLLMAEEYGAVCRELGFDREFLMEHGQILLSENAIEELYHLTR